MNFNYKQSLLNPQAFMSLPATMLSAEQKWVSSGDEI